MYVYSTSAWLVAHLHCWVSPEVREQRAGDGEQCYRVECELHQSELVGAGVRAGASHVAEHLGKTHV